MKLCLQIKFEFEKRHDLISGFVRFVPFIRGDGLSGFKVYK
jgi:hypothetical protein